MQSIALRLINSVINSVVVKYMILRAAPNGLEVSKGLVQLSVQERRMGSIQNSKRMEPVQRSLKAEWARFEAEWARMPAEWARLPTSPNGLEVEKQRPKRQKHVRYFIFSGLGPHY